MKKIASAIKGETPQQQQQKLQQQISDSDGGVRHQAAELALTSSHLKELQKKFEAQNKTAATYIESGRALADTFKEFSTSTVETGNQTPLVNCLKGLVDFQRYLEDARSDLNNSLTNNVTNAFAKTVKGEIKDALEFEKKYEKARGAYESAETKLKGLSEKSKLNLAKIVETEQERDSTKIAYEESDREATKILQETNSKMSFEVLARLVYYIETQYDFFEQVYTKMQTMRPEIEEYRKFVEQRMGDFEKSTGVAVERILQPKGTSKARRFTTVMDRTPLASSNSSTTSIGSELTVEEEDIQYDPAKESEKKKKTLQDVVSSERLYVNNLRSIKQNYYPQLVKAAKDPKMKLSEEDVNCIFANVEELYNLHSRIFDDLDSALDAYPKKSIGSIFLDKMQSLNRYVNYASNYAKANEALHNIKKKNSIATLLRSCEKTDTSGSSLETLLSLPLKRINQYEFWLEVMYEATPTTDPDFQKLEEALKAVTSLSELVLECNVKAGELSHMMSIQKRLTGFDQSLVDSERHLVKEGPLMMLNERKDGKKISNYYFFVFNDMVLYASKAKISSKVQAVRQGTSLKKESFVYKGHFSTVQLNVHVVDDLEGIKNAFQIVAKDGHTYSVGTTTSEEKSDWIHALQKAGAEANARKVFGVDLTSLMKNQFNEGNSILPFAEKALNFIEHNAVKTEGIFRLSGSAVQIEKFREELNRGKELNMNEMDPHAISGLFKLWLREMPEPLLTYNLYDNWVGCGKLSDSAQAAEYAKSLMPHLPLYNRFLLQFMSAFLVKVAKNSDVNKMASSNLSIVFGPNILYKKDADPYDTSDFKYVYAVVQLFIDHYDLIFHEVEEERRNWEEKEGKEVLEKKEKDQADKEKMRQEQKETKLKKEEQVKQAKELKERKEREEKEKKEKEEEEKKRKEQELKEQKAKQEVQQRMNKEIQAEKEKEKMKEEEEKAERKRIKEEEKAKEEERLRKEKEVAEKRKKAEEEYQRLRKEEEEAFRLKKEEERKAKEEEERKKREAHEKQLKEEEEEERRKREEQSPHCAACEKPILGQGVNAIGRKWHSECFNCNTCNKPLSGTFLHKDGKIYCPEDFAKQFGKSCGGCGQPITGQFIKAINKEWHPTGCFVCFNCKGPFTSGFFEKNSKPYCRNCVQNIQ